MIRYPAFSSVKQIDDFMNAFEDDKDQSWRDKEIQWTWTFPGGMPVYTTMGQFYDDVLKPYCVAQRLLLQLEPTGTHSNK